MSQPIAVYIHGTDPISQAGVASQLRARPELEVLSDARIDDADVAVVVSDAMNDDVRRSVAALRRGNRPRIVLVAGVIDEAAVVAAAEIGIVGLLRRQDTTADALLRCIRKVAAGEGDVPPDLLGRVMDQLGRLQRQFLSPRGLVFAGLSPREADVLRLVAEGFDTAEIAKTLCYSERTVKNVLHQVTNRLQLRNRSHAVAYALREGLI